MPKKTKKINKTNKVDILYFWEALAIAFVLFLTAMLLLLINLNVSAKEHEDQSPNIKTLEIAFWQNVIKDNPTYLEGYLKLFELTNNERFLEEAQKINPVYFLLQK